MRKTTKRIKIQRTEYTLDEIYGNEEKESGKSINKAINKTIQPYKQLDLFDLLVEDDIDSENENPKEMRYTPVNIIDVYKAEMEEADG